MVTASGWFKSDSLTWTTQSQVRIPVPQFLFKIDGKLEQDTLTIRNSELAVPGITASGSFSVSHISHESPEAYGRFSTNTFEWGTLKKHIPESILKNYFPDFVNRISSGSLIFKSIELKSTLHTPVQTIFNSLTGTGELHNLHVAINNTLPVLKLNNCTFSFSKGDIIFDHARVQCYPDDTHELTGKISNVLQNPLLDLSSSSKIPAAAVTNFLSGLLKNTNSKVNDATTFFAGSGMLTSSTVLNIPLTAGQLAKFSSTIDLTQADYTISTAVAKPAGVPNQATFSGTFVTGKIPEAINFNVHLNRNCVQFTGMLSNWSSPILDLTYSLSNADISVLKYPILHPDTSIRAILSGEGVIKIPLLQPEGIAITGSLLANGFEIKKVSDPTPLLNFSIAAAIRGQTLTFNKVSGSFGKSSLTGSGTMHGWDTTPQGNFKADVLSLDLDDFIVTVISFKKLNMVQIKLTAAAPQSLSQPQSTEKTFFRRALFYVDATVLKGKFLSWQFTDGTTQVSIKDGLLNFDDITIYGYRGTVKGLVSLDFAQTDLYTLRIVPSASVIEFNEFLPELKQGIVLSGTMDLDGTFSSTYTHGYEVVPRMHGGFRVQMKNMKFGKFTFVSKIFSLVNFSEIIKLHAPDIFSTGMPFDTVVGSFVMEKGIAHTDDVFFKGPAMNLSTVGDINFSKKELDFVIGVQPLETIAKLLGEIPIAGSIITGENKTLTLSYFNVKGPYIDPSVKPMPVESLSQGVKTIFKRIFKLPRELLNSGKKKEDHSSKNIQETTK
jgi:hypothetical protein